MYSVSTNQSRRYSVSTNQSPGFAEVCPTLYSVPRNMNPRQTMVVGYITKMASHEGRGADYAIHESSEAC